MTIDTVPAAVRLAALVFYATLVPGASAGDTAVPKTRFGALCTARTVALCGAVCTWIALGAVTTGTDAGGAYSAASPTLRTRGKIADATVCRVAIGAAWVEALGIVVTSPCSGAAVGIAGTRLIREGRSATCAANGFRASA